MATDIERLIVSLEASTAKYERALVKANQQTDQRVKAMQSRFDGLGAGISRAETRIVGSLGSVSQAFGILGIGLTTASIIAMTAAWTDLNSRVNNAAGGVERGAAVMEQLSTMARRTYSSLSQTAESYLDNSQALTALGYSTQQQLNLTEALNNSLVISATRGQAAQSVMDAWSKAMAEGKLSGDNLNTVIQSGGRLSKALADSMGVSVNELRKLGSEGKITTDVMFGVTGQLETLRAEAEQMPATVSDGFLLLQDAVFKFVGQADAAVGSSNALATALVGIADAIDQAPDQSWFDSFFKSMGDELGTRLARDAKDIQGLITLLEYLGKTSPDEAILDLNEALGGTVRAGSDLEIALTNAEQAMANLATNTEGRFGEVDAAVQDLFQQILEGRGSVESAHAAVDALASVNPDFADLKAGVLSVIDTLFAMRDAANAANAAAANTTTDLGQFPTKRSFNQTFGPDLSGDGRPGGPIRPTSGGGGSKKSPTEKFQEDLDQYARKIEMLKQETALTASLSPLLNDYGQAKAKLTAQQQLENDATKAGLDLTPERRQSIETLATAYASATVEAAKLAKSQDEIRESAKTFADAAKEGMRGFIDDLINGKSAAEALGNALGSIGSKLLDKGLDAIFGAIFPFADGGIAAHGRPKRFASGGISRSAAIFGEAGPEAAVPLPDGRRIPVDLRLPAVPKASGGAEAITNVAYHIDAKGAELGVEDKIVAAIKQNNKQLPNLMQEIQMRQG